MNSPKVSERKPNPALNLQKGSSWTYKELEVRGVSLSGIYTCLTLPQFHLAFDVAQGFPFCLQMKTFFISHGHMDHAAGIPYIISQKAMHQHPAPVFYMPEDLVEPLEVIMQQWMKIENHQYQYHFKPLKAGDRVEVKPGFFVEALQTYHRVSSLAYCLIETKKKLKVQYSHLHGGKIAELKKNGVVVEDHSEKALFTFSGDTTSEFLKKSERARQSQILAIESTYVDQSKTIEHAKKWGHTHWDEILPMIPTLDCEKILVLHISSRYSTDYAQKKISEQLSSQDQERVVVFEGR